ncbi:hypothetical protein H5410_005478 [Solanum commersonii]|uniref:Gag-pro-like protein n=1 Tax=Solanum commersonii TaxID=4109 RepID=A0A9J6A7N8_SOLCO|nr:hypothetical protein H5410_005478 [Solanum commersonii]
MSDKDEFNAAANIMIRIENPEGSRNMTDIQNEEKMARIEQELEILREELPQVRDLAKLSATIFPTFKTPIYFTKADLSSAGLPNQPEQTQHTPSHGRVPPGSPTAVRTIPDLSNRDPTISTMQQILGAHVTAPYEPHVPPVYAVGAPTFTMPAVLNVPYKVDQYAEMEKDTQLKEDGSINAQLQGLRKALKCLKVTRGTKSLDYDDLCIHPDIDMPEVAEHFMTRFRFNTKITADRFSFANIQKKPFENFQEYARRWRIETARVQPPLDESELSKYFIRAQEGIYFDKMMSMMGQKFAELVKMGDFMEEGVKSGKIQSVVALQAASRAIQLGSIGGIKNKRLRTVGVLQPIEGKLPDPIPHNFDGNKRCAYHSGVQRHDTKDCYGLKNQIESLIRRGVIKCTLAPPNVNNNPLPNYENGEVNMVTLDEEYGGPDYPSIDEPNAMTSSAQFDITVQLREPLTVQTYLPRVVVTTLIARKPKYNIKALSHPILSVNFIPVADELDGAIFHTLEIMQDVKPKNGLGPKSNGIVEPIQLKLQRGINKLRYEPTSGRDHHGSNNMVFVPKNDLIPDQAMDDHIVEGIRNLFVAMDGEEEEINLSKLTIHNVEPGEILQNWTIDPSLFQPESW